MKILLYLEAALLALGAAMTVTLAVVCLLFAINRDVSPEITRGLPQLLKMTLDCLLLSLCAAAAVRGLWKITRWRWIAQAVLFCALPIFASILYGNLSAA